MTCDVIHCNLTLLTHSVELILHFIPLCTMFNPGAALAIKITEKCFL